MTKPITNILVLISILPISIRGSLEIIDLKPLLFLEQGIQFQKDEDKNLLTLSQGIPGAKAYFIGGSLENYNVVFEGMNIVEDSKKFNLISFPKIFL